MEDANTLKVHQAIARTLHDNGVEAMFGLMGDANMFMVDYFIRACGGRYIPAANEAGATYMAIGYALMTGKVGVCSTTCGPGLTNTMTGLVEAVRGSTPMVLVTGTTPVSIREHPQHVSHSELALAVGAGYELVRSAASVADDTARALRRAQIERRPVILDMPAELEWSDAEGFTFKSAYVPENRAVTQHSDDLDNAIGIIAAARRPLIVAGRGATAPDCREAILRLARRIEAPVATTLKAKDLFRGEDDNLGICGTLSLPNATEIILESDCVIAFGASLNLYTLSLGAYRAGKRFIQVNLEPEEVGKNITPDAGIIGYSAAVADQFVHWLDEAEIAPSGWCGDALKARMASDGWPALAPKNRPGTVDFMSALQRLDRGLPADKVLVPDAGRFAIGVWKYMHVADPGCFVTTTNYASIGLALPHGIGAAVGAPEKTVVVIAGDGGFMNAGLAEFNTAVRCGTNIVVVVLNDGAYGYEMAKFSAYNVEQDNLYLDWPDFAPVAIALGGEGVTVRNDDDWDAAFDAVERRTKPLLIDVKIDPLAFSDNE